MQYIARKILGFLVLAVPVTLADSLSYWERQGIVNINFDEPVVSRSVVENQHLGTASAADKGHDLFCISGDEAHPPRVLWVDQDCLRIEPAPGTSIRTEFKLNFRGDVRYLSGRVLQQREFRFHAPGSPLVNEELRSCPNGAVLVSARHQHTAESRALGPQSAVSYTFRRVKMDDKGDFFETGESAPGVVEAAQLRHGNSFSVLRSLAARGVKWEELQQDSPLPGYVVVRPGRQLPQGSIWRLTAKADPASGLTDSYLGDIHVSRSLHATLEQGAGQVVNGVEASTLELRFNSLVEKAALQQAFREMRFTLDGVETTLSDDATTRSAVVNGREIKLRYLGELEGQSFGIRPDKPEVLDAYWELEEEEAGVTDVQVKYAHPTAASGMRLSIESPVPLLAECTLKAGMEGVLGLPLEQDFTTRCSITPMSPDLIMPVGQHLPLHGSHQFEMTAVNGSYVSLRLRHWKADEAPAALRHIRRHLEQQERRSSLGELLYNRAVTQARIRAGLAAEEELPSLPEGYERAREVYRDRIFLQPAGGRVVAQENYPLPGGGKSLLRADRMVFDLKKLCGGQPLPGMYLVELDFHPSAAVAAAARELGLDPAELVLRRDKLVSVSDLAVFGLQTGDFQGAVVLQHSSGQVVPRATATQVNEEEVCAPREASGGIIRLDDTGSGEIVVRSGQDYGVFQVASRAYWREDDAGTTTGQAGAELRATAWTDRALYRPGDKIYVRGYLRAVDGQNRITHSQHRELQLHFDAPDGSRLFTRVFEVDEFGAFSQELTLPEGEDDVCGRYTISVGTTRPRTLCRLYPRCEVFRRDSFHVELDDLTPRVAPDAVVFRIKASDYNGLPVSQGRVELRVDSTHPLEGFCQEQRGMRRNYTRQLTLPLAEDGTAEFRAALSTPAAEGFRVTVGGSVVNAREEHIRLAGGGQYAAAELTPELVAAERLQLRCSHCGAPMHYGVSARVTLLGSRLRAQKLPNGFTITGKQEEKIWSQWVNVPADSVEGVQLPFNELISRCRGDFDNAFSILVEGRDNLGHTFAHRFTRYASSLGLGSSELVLKQAGRPGYLAVESLVDGELLLVLRSGASCRALKLPVQRGISEIAVPLQGNEGGLVNVHAALLRRNPGTQLLEQSCRHALELMLPAAQNALNMKLELPGTVRPGSLQTLAGQVTLPDGSPAPAVVTLYAVDAGALSPAAYTLPDVARDLSHWQSSWLRVVDSMYALTPPQRWHLGPLPGVWQGEGCLPGGSWKHQPWWMQDDRGAAAPMAMAAGAAGSGRLYKKNTADTACRARALAGAEEAAPEGGLPPAALLRTNFNPLAIWRSALRTDAAGRFSTTCTMPDTLTTYRVVAVAADKGGSRFCTADGEFTVNQDVMLSAGTPLFMSVGDTLQLPVSITNNTAAEGTWQVQLAGSGEPQQVTLAAGATATLCFEVSPQQPGTHSCRWVATSSNGEDAVQGSFDVRYPAPLLKEAHHLVLEAGQEELVPRELVAPELTSAPDCRLELLVSANPLIHVVGGVDFLLEQPETSCLEHSASALLPWLLYDRLAPLCPRLASTPAGQVQRTISRTVDNLLKHQNQDGGLPFWQGAGESSCWVSAHVAMVLRMAEERGHSLPQRQWHNLLRYLEKADFSTAHPLTRYEAARALQNREAQREALKAALASSETSWWCSGSVRHDIEFLEYLRTNNDGRHEAFLRWMRSRAADYRHHSSWRSAWSLYALMTYIGHSPGARVDAILRLPHGVAVLGRGVYRVQNPALATAYASLRGTVYAVLRARALPRQADYPGVTEKGLQITRLYEKKGGDGIWREATDLAVGDVVRVSLTCAKAGEQNLHHLVLEDYLPACMEAINPDVPGQAAGLDPLHWSEYFDHREYLADRVRGFCTRWPGRDAVNLRYYARVKRAGSATAPPAQAQLLYEPQTYGLSPSARINVRAAGAGADNN